ncbi:MAG: type I polyketide synthase, partial [bacterium]|nr:type I polyketide synthase [bacterium]
MSEIQIPDTMTGDEIAVIGMACRFPGAQNVSEFWNNLKQGVESISFISDEELNEMEIEPGMLNHPDYVKSKGGVLECEEYFDASFFGYSAAEASIMDSQMRVFHECVWEAMEYAGYAPGAYKGLIGLYAGASSTLGQYTSLSFDTGEAAAIFAHAILSDKDFLCTRISHKLDLKGPSIAINTACSTSLVAIHMACQAILNAECSIALAGGVSISEFLEKGYIYQEGMIASPDGHCRAFDAKAKGTIGGNGAGVVVLKALEDAVDDGDTIHAIVKGTVINNDGFYKSNFTAPARDGQSKAIRMAHQLAEIETESITYIECHGTGTPLGDPIEIEALRQAFDTPEKGFCAVGSVKTNIGHLNTAAGVAGFIKTVMALKHRLIPPSLHFEKPNPIIDFANSPFYVNTKLQEWKNESYPLRAGVSSFGIGGTNAHVILEEPLEMEETREEKKRKLLLLSAKTETALQRAVENLHRHLKENPGINLSDAAYTLQVGRKAFQHRISLACSNVEEAVAALTQSEPGGTATLQTGNAQWLSTGDKQPQTVFMFPGQGSQYLNMGLELFETEASFRDDVEFCFEILKKQTGIDIKAILYPPPGAEEEKSSSEPGDRVNQTQITQPVLFVFEYALARLLMKWGITPDAMIGHSIGEYAAACLSGVFTLEDALTLVYTRGKLMQMQPAGAMLSVSLPEEELLPLLKENVSLAAVNAPSLSVVSGTFEAIREFEKQLNGKQYTCRRLHTSHAFHSEMMNPVLKQFEAIVGQMKLSPPKIPFIS